MNRADTLRALANEQKKGWPVVVPALKRDYVLGVTKQNVKQGYYTKLFSDVDDQMVVKAGEDMRADIAVTLQGFADDSTEYTRRLHYRPLEHGVVSYEVWIRYEVV